MNVESQNRLVAIFKEINIGSLGTVRDGHPFVTMVLFIPAPDYSAFYINVSKLTYPAQNMMMDSRVSLMLAEDEAKHPDPQQLARISIIGTAKAMEPSDPECPDVRARYIKRFPSAAQALNSEDFMMFRIVPEKARYVAALGQIHELSVQQIKDMLGV